MKIGIRGAGFMTRRIADTINQMGEGYELYSLCTSSVDSATRGKEFQEEYGFEKVFHSFDEMLRDPELDLVYIALTNQLHFEAMKKCIEYGKPVICEKPLCMNEREAREITSLAKERGVFLAEAAWPNYAPSRWLVDDLLKSGIVGEIKTVEIEMANKVFVDHRTRMEPLWYGGGSLMDFGAYTIGAMTMAHFGHDIEIESVEYEYADSGVDVRDDIVLKYAEGPTIHIRHDALKEKPFVKYGKFYGEKGVIEVDGTSKVVGLRALDPEGNLIKEVEIPEMITGYEYEFMACKRCIEAGELEPAEQTHDMSIRELAITDKLREMGGIKFPCDI